MTTNLRILSYNIHKGFSPGNRSFVLSQMKEAIRSVDANLVFLQEVLGEHRGHAQTVPGWPTESQFEFLADDVWPHFAYGKNAVYLRGHHGNAILSKFPIRTTENLDVSTNIFENRGILHCQVELPDGPPLHAVCLHFNLFQRSRAWQLEQLCQRIATEIPRDHPAIVAGDFNDWSQRASDVIFDRVALREIFLSMHGRHARTFPSFFPMMCLDRVYTRGMRLKEAKVLRQGVWSNLSDHAAVFAEVEL